MPFAEARLSRQFDPENPGEPLLIGVGSGGKRILSRGARTGARRVTIADEERPAELGARLERATGILVCDLGEPDAAEALALAEEWSSSAAGVVLVLPFSFESAGASRLAIRAAAGLAPGTLLAVASRDEALAVADPSTSLEEAYCIVDEIAVTGAEALAFALASGARAGSLLPLPARREKLGTKRGTALGAAAIEEGGPAEAVRRAAGSILLAREVVASSEGALVAMVSGRPATLAEVRAVEEFLGEMLAPAAELEIRPRTVPELGLTALAAVCVEPPAEPGQECEFPSEDPLVLEIPAFLRKRAARSRQERWPFERSLPWRKTA